MSEEVIKISLKGEDAGLTKAVGDATKAVESFGKAAKSIPKGAADASNSIGNLSRIVQDAPFGFIGIANNINPMLESFQRLQKETGSTKAALTSMISGLAGPAGLGLAVAAASSLLVVFGDKIFGSGKKTEDAAKKVADYKREIDGIYSNVAGEATQVQTLIAVLQSETSERGKIIAALKELKSINPDIFGQLKLEGGAVAGLSTAYKEYVANLRTVIAAKITQARLDKVTTDILKAEGADLTKSEKDFINSLAETNKKYNEKRQAVGQLTLGDKRLAQEQEKLNNLYKQQGELMQNLSEFSEGIKVKGFKVETPEKDKSQFNFFDKFFDVTPAKEKVQKQLTEMADTARDFASKNFNLFEGLDEVLFASSDQKAIEAGKRFWENFQKGVVQLKVQPLSAKDLGFVPEIKPSDVADGKQQIENFLRNTRNAFENATNDKAFSVSDLLAKDIKSGVAGKDVILDYYKNQFASLGTELPKFINITDAITGATKKIAIKDVFNTKDLLKSLDEAEAIAVARVVKLNEVINTAMQDIAVQGFVAIGQGIADAVSGGGIGEAFEALGNLIGTGLQSLGQQMIALAPIMASLKLAIKTFDPTGGILSGVALIAIGGVLKNSLKVPGLAQGGIIPPGFEGDKFLARLNSGEAVIPLNQINGLLAGAQAQPMRVMPRLRGRDMLLQQVREQKTQRRTT